MFRAPLSRFVSERNALAAALKKEGHPEASAEVKALKKPGASAWAVNQLFWRQRELFEALLASGDAYREAQREALSGAGSEALERAETERNEAMRNAQAAAESALAEHGLSLTPTVAKRIATTLEALASYGHQNPEPYDGLASDDLSPPGFAALATLAPPPAVQTSSVREPERAKRIEPKPEADVERELELELARMKRESEKQELDATIESIAAEHQIVVDAITRVEHELSELRQKEATLKSKWEALKGRRRELD